MVIHIQEFLARRYGAAPRVQTALIAAAGGAARFAQRPRQPQRTAACLLTLTRTLDAQIALPQTMADTMMLYAEASLI